MKLEREMFRREFVTSIHVADPITFCIDIEESILSELRSQFEGYNYKNSHVVKIDKILEKSDCIINVTGLDAAATVNVKFSCFVDIISAKDILYPVEITAKDPMIIGICKQNYNVFAACTNTPEMATIKIKQTIPLVIDQSIHEYKAKNAGCIGKFLTYNNNSLPVYKIAKISQSHYTKILESEIMKDIMNKIVNLQAELKKMPTDIVDFFEKLYDSSDPIVGNETFDIMDKKLPEIKGDSIIISREGIKRTSPKVNIVRQELKSAQTVTLDIAIQSYIYDVYNYLRLIRDLVKTHNTKALVRENNSIWKLVRPNFTGGFENSDSNSERNQELDSSVISTVLNIPGESATNEDGTRFSKNIIEAAEKYGSKFKWDTIRIVKETPQYSLMPWHLNSQNSALRKITAGRTIKTMIDLTSHVGIDSINLAYEFSEAKLIGIELDPDICKLYKCNMAMIVNKYEANCGNGVDIIQTLERHEPRTSLVYLDPPWGGTEYKNKDSVPLKLTDSKGRTHNMIDIVKLIFNRSISDLIILKAPNNYDMQDKLLQEPTWDCEKYEIRNEIARSSASGGFSRGNELKPGEFGKLSYLLFAIKSKEFIPPSYKDGKQFQYIICNDELQTRLTKLLQKFGIDPNLKDFAELSDIEIYQKLCSQIKESKSDNQNFGKSRGFKRYKDISEYLNDSSKPKKYMDIGAGDCEITADIAQALKLKKSETFGIDYVGSPSKRAEKLVTFHLVKPGDKLPIPDKEIDLITAFQSMHHFQDLQYKLEEMTRITNMNTILVIREHDLDDRGILRPLVDIEHLLYMICFEGLNYGQAIEAYWAHYRTRNEWNKLLTELGWQLINFRETPSPTNYYYAGYSRMNEEA